ncbi:MAG: hypothetical protein ACREOQ_21340 [Gemmatimonadales bacterium]
MNYKPRIKADPIYLQALGQALYNFTYLEWVVVWTIVSLSSDGFGSVPTGETAAQIAKALTRAIASTVPALPDSLRRQLAKFDESYRAAIKVRNKLLHAHPLTAPDGRQQLGSAGSNWTLEQVEVAAKQFEDAAIQGSAIFHGELAKLRP